MFFFCNKTRSSSALDNCEYLPMTVNNRRFCYFERPRTLTIKQILKVTIHGTKSVSKLSQCYAENCENSPLTTKYVK